MSEKTIGQQRRERASALLLEAGLDALVITDPHNVRYLTGFTGSNSAVLLYESGRAVLYTDPRYTVQSKRQVDCPVRIARGPLTKSVVSDIGRHAFGRVGFEADRLTVNQFDAFRKELPARTSFEAAPFHILTLRMVKDEGETALIRASVLSNSRALEAALKRLRAGMTEAEFAAEIDYQNRRLGAEAPSFDTIVAAGERASLPHAHPGATKIGPGMLLIDMGAFREGYASDMTRMVHVGRAGAKYRKAYRAVLDAQLAAIDAVRAGTTTASVDRAARTTLRKYGFEKAFVHSTGHGLGLEIHEPPRIGRKDLTKLEPGMAITIEPGVYLEGWGGIRIEDTVLVTSNGCEILTPTSKELREI